MKCRSWFFVSVIIVLFFSCGKEVNQAQLVSEIRTWWGAGVDIEDVVVDDYSIDGKTMTVLARLIVYGDTTDRMTYKFESFEQGWRISEGPVDPLTKAAIIERMGKAKVARLKNNMHTLQLAIEDFATMSEGYYPPDLVTAVIELNNKAQGEYLQKTVIAVLPTVMRNPFVESEPPVCGARGDPHEWLPEYRGKAIYFPIDADSDGDVEGYVIKGSTNTGFIDITLTSGF